MNKELEILQNHLKNKNIESEVKSILKDHDFNCLEWESGNGWRNRVYSGSVLIINCAIRAYQEERLNRNNDEIYKYSLVIVSDSKQEHKEDLVQIDRVENRFDCLYLAEHENSIIHIHKHALYTTILSYKDGILKRYHSESELINRKGDLVSIQRVQTIERDKPVELIKLPELKKLKTITQKESEELNLRPIGNFPLRFLNNR